MVRTKPHKTLQSPVYKPLSPEQENAIDLLILGKTDCEVAEAVGVTRETIWHWRHEHQTFLAELNRRRQALWSEAQRRVTWWKSSSPMPVWTYATAIRRECVASTLYWAYRQQPSTHRILHGDLG